MRPKKGRMEIYKVYFLIEDGSKIFIYNYSNLEEAQDSMVDEKIIYSIEKWSGASATVIL